MLSPNAFGGMHSEYLIKDWSSGHLTDKANYLYNSDSLTFNITAKHFNLMIGSPPKAPRDDIFKVESLKL